MSGMAELLEYRPEVGGLFLNGVRYLLIRPETLMGLAAAAGSDAEQLFFAAGKEGGRLSAEKLTREQGLGPKAAVEAMLQMGCEIGWGRMTLRSFDQEDCSFSVAVTGSALCGPGGRCCGLLAGVLAGLGSVVFAREMKVSEITCVSAGADACVFEAVPRG